MPVVSAPPSRRAPKRASTNSHLPHWSEVVGEPTRSRPSPQVAAVLRDLVSWAADIAIRLTDNCPEDREAIERVRSYACAWLSGSAGPDIAIDDVLTSAAALMAGIDRKLVGPNRCAEERPAIGAAVDE